MKKAWDEFYELLNGCLHPTLEKNIIIYGCQGGDFVRWFYEKFYEKEVKAVIDRWELSPKGTVLHLWSLYYIYEKNDVIINTTPYNIVDEFNDTGEDWKRIGYQENEIINLWELLYGTCLGENRDELKYEITYFDWLEFEYGIDLLTTVKRKFVTGEHAHGYFPTDFRIFLEGIQRVGICEDDTVLDIGCGKGSGVLALLACGFKNVGAIEYTTDIYNILISNLTKMNICYTEGEINKNFGANGGVVTWHGDATLMKEELDNYNWFFLFNPFSWEVMESVTKNICDSIKRKFRKVHIFYAEPIGHQIIMNTGMFRLKERICSDLSNVSYFSYIYDSI